MPTVAADTNVLVRFLVRQPPDQYTRGRALMEKVSGGQVKVRISAVVVGEVRAILHGLAVASFDKGAAQEARHDDLSAVVSDPCGRAAH